MNVETKFILTRPNYIDFVILRPVQNPGKSLTILCKTINEVIDTNKAIATF